MDKFEYKVRAEEIRALIAQGDYAQAVEIADAIDWRRVKSVMMLCTVSDLYKINRRYEDARDMLLLAYDRHPGGRSILYALCELSIKMEEFVQAVEYYKEFVQIAPKDTGRYILQYKLYEAQDVSLEERIAVLEELKKRDYREKWAYELAYLYHRVGLSTRCVEECDELILWFGDGKYVIKALELKMLHQPLTPVQQQKYEYRFQSQSDQQEQAQENHQTDRQEPDRADQTEEPDENQDALEEVSEQENPEISGQEEVPEQGEESTEQIVSDQSKLQNQEAEIIVKTVDVSQFNTINLQRELAEGLKEIFGEEDTQEAEFQLDNNLSMEADGQISMVVEEEIPVEKQITGQMSIDEVLTEWQNRESEEFEVQEEETQILEESEAQEEETQILEESEAQEEKTQAPVDLEASEPVKKALVRNLTIEEKELFGPFIQKRSARENLVQALDRISLAAYTGNVIVTGDPGMDTLELAKNIVRNIQMTDSNFSGKTAKISGSVLNEKDAALILDQLQNGALIIEKASEINQKTADVIYNKIQQESLGIVMILEDTRKNINRFLESKEQLAKCFNARIDLEALSNDALVAFGKKYAREMECSIDELGVLALHTRIADMQMLDHAVTIREVKEIMDQAIHHAGRKTIGHFMDVLIGKRYDEEDMIILREKDFI